MYKDDAHNLKTAVDVPPVNPKPKPVVSVQRLCGER